jgi:two-component system, chemotaxis family, protein-glutamate methylesterase/glutaminase
MQDSIPRGSPYPADSNRRTRVLIVDDFKMLQRLLKLILSNQPDMEVVGIANDGQECLELAAALRPDVITLDVNMPVMDGIETLKNLRKSSDVPVIIVSGLPVDEDPMQLQLKDLGATATVVKNFSNGSIGIASFESDLLKAIRNITSIEMTQR